MMVDRNVTIAPRKEEIREKSESICISIQFDLDEIKAHFYDSLKEIELQFDIAEELEKSGHKDQAQDIWRSQVVFLEGIMDFYMHEISKYALVSMFTGKWEKSDNYKNFMIPMSTVEEGLKQPESTEWLFERLNFRFSSETYLSGEPLGSQLSLIGMNYKAICDEAFPRKGKKDEGFIPGQQRIKMLFDRRNQIAHQADRKHENAEKENITREYVENAISTVRTFVDIVHKNALLKQN